MNQKQFLIPIAIAILLVVAGVGLYFVGMFQKEDRGVSRTTGEEQVPAAPISQEQQAMENTPSGVPPADPAGALVNDLLKEALSDGAILFDPAADAALVRSDSAELSDLGTVYDNTIF